MQRIIPQVHQWVARLLLLGLIIQVYLATAPFFGVAVSFQPHRSLGYALSILVGLLVVLALVGRLGGNLIRLSSLLVFLFVIQITLPTLRGDVPWIAALHPVNALALIAVSVRIARPRASGAGLAAASGSLQ